MSTLWQICINVANCNLGEVKHETMLASGLHHLLYVGRSLGALVIYSAAEEVNHFVHVAFAR